MNSNDIMINGFIEYCFGLYTDIVLERQNSKLPKILTNLRYTFYTNKLLKTINKYKNSHYPLSKDNLSSYFNLVYNTYQPNRSYKSVTKIAYSGDHKSLQAKCSFDKYIATITIVESENTFDIDIVSADPHDIEFNNLHLSRYSLQSTNDTDHLLDTLDDQLLSDMANMIIDYIDDDKRIKK